MTIQEILTKVDELKPNQYPTEQKISWLNDIEKKIWNEICLKREHEGLEFNGYSSDVDVNTEVLAKMYDELYVHYLMAQIDYYNGEYSRYNVTSAMFNTYYQAFKDWYYRNHDSILGATFKNI